MQNCRSLQSLSILLAKGGHGVGDCVQPPHSDNVTSRLYLYPAC